MLKYALKQMDPKLNGQVMPPEPEGLMYSGIAVAALLRCHR